MAYAAVGDVEARLSGRTFSATGDPTIAEVTAWITQAEARLNKELEAVGFTTVTDADGILIVKDVVTSRVAARAIKAFAAGTNFDTEKQEADLMKEWDDFLADIRSAPGRIGTLIGQAFGSAADRGNLRAYTRDNSKGKSVGNGDYDPVFSKDDDL